MENLGLVFSDALLGLWYGFINFVPGLILAIVLFIVGWVVGKVVGKAIAQLVTAMKVDKLFEGAGAGEMMEKMGFKLNVGKFLGMIVKYFIVVVFLMAALEIIGLTQVNDFLRTAVLYYLPKVIIASIVLVIATILADATRKLVKASASAASVTSANMLATISYYAIWIFALVIALAELGIATYFMQVLFMGVVVMFAIAGGLAFGLGGKEAASRCVDKISKEF